MLQRKNHLGEFRKTTVSQPTLIKDNYFLFAVEMHYSKAWLSKERAFLFLSIILTVTLLTGFPENLKVFVLGTTSALTGGATAVKSVEVKDYFIGLVIFAALFVFTGYIVHVLRTPRTQNWYPEGVEEGFNISIDQDLSLDNDLERVNQELKKLRLTKEEAPKKKAKKVTKVPKVEEIHLEQTLRNITAQLQGYARTPYVLEAPPEKSEWDEPLEQVKNELASVEKMKAAKAKVREEAPSKTDIALRYESRKIQQELKESLAKAKKISKPITVLEEPSPKKTWNEYLKKVNNELENVDAMEIAKVKIRETAPSMKEVAEAVEKKRLTQALKKVSGMLKKGERDSSYFIRRYTPSLRGRELAQIKKKLLQKGSLPAKELKEIEKKLMELKGKN